MSVRGFNRGVSEAVRAVTIMVVLSFVVALVYSLCTRDYPMPS